MDAEERKAAQKEFEDYCRKYRHYKHYRDREKILLEPCIYQYPISKAQREFVNQTMRTARSYHPTPMIVFQSISDLRDQYGKELPHDLIEKMAQKQLPDVIQGQPVVEKKNKCHPICKKH